MGTLIEQKRLLTVAEDIEYFAHWLGPVDVVNNTVIRHGSGVLRRLLVEDAVGAAWRNLGYKKEPTIQGPDLLAFFKYKGYEISLTANAVAGGVANEGIDTAFLVVRSVDNPTTGVLASADVGFAVEMGSVMRDARTRAPSAEFDPFIEHTWYVHQYLNAPGMIRTGEVISRREIIKHVANEMGGVHVGNSTSPDRQLQVDAEDKIFIKGLKRELRGHHIEILAIGQAVAKSKDMQLLASEIRKKG